MNELTHNDFLKKIALIESKLNQKFGSTYNLRVRCFLPKFQRRFTVLRSAFVHKTAQNHYKYVHNRYELSVSYAFAITDPVINDYVYGTLKHVLESLGAYERFGYQLHHKPARVVAGSIPAPESN